MPRRPPTLLFSVFMLIAGTLAGYCILRLQGWSMQTELILIWSRMTPLFRVLMIACLAATAYGIGGILNWLLRRFRPR